ncbi:uncharacterized protein ACB057_004442 [Neosynchiropus ocellatus]
MATRERSLRMRPQIVQIPRMLSLRNEDSGRESPQHHPRRGHATHVAISSPFSDSGVCVPAGVLQLLVIKEEVSPEQQESSSSLDQQGREPGLLKEVKEEEEEHDVSQLSLTAVDVKTEDDEKPPTSSLTLHLKTEADGDNCGGSEPASCLDTPLHPDQQRSLSSESDTDDSEDWRGASDSQSGSRAHDSEMKDVADERSHICSECGRKCSSKGGLTRHVRSCSGGSFTCSVCGKCYKWRHHLKGHVRAHTGENPFSCSQCDKSFSMSGRLKRHVDAHCRKTFQLLSL